MVAYAKAASGWPIKMKQQRPRGAIAVGSQQATLRKQSGTTWNTGHYVHRVSQPEVKLCALRLWDGS